jgi:mannose-1-phosphate guanylyltransferase
MSAISNRQPAWAVLLAGGDGTRLQSLTFKIADDSRPKQFCRLFDGKSLLSQTRERVEPLFHRDRTMFVVTRAHEEFYREDLWHVNDSSIIEQPRNRGTGAAIAAALLRILQLGGDPLVAFFPCDHYCADNRAFARIASSALAFAQQHPKSIIVLGAEAHYPEVEYGWIEPEPVQDEASGLLRRVSRFWEKPALPLARTLLRRGCLWNTFVTIGRASAFVELLGCQIPDVMLHIAAGLAHGDLDAAYRRVRPADFSREVLAPLAHRLLVVRDAVSGWRT